jgi:serine/threonine protein kinase
MALVDGPSLATRFSTGPVEPREAAKLVHQVARAIDYAHNKGVIHGYLKPSNILLDAQGRPRVTDFGLAKRVSLEKALPMSGDVLGTLSYMSPEQAARRIDAVGPSTDVYALGAVLYELMSGRPPFHAASNVDMLRQVIGSEPVPLRQLNRAIPRDLETITLKCLEKSIARRYASAADLAAELKRYLRGKPILAKPTSRVRRVWQGCCQFLWTRQSLAASLRSLRLYI